MVFLPFVSKTQDAIKKNYQGDYEYYSKYEHSGSQYVLID